MLASVLRSRGRVAGSSKLSRAAVAVEPTTAAARTATSQRCGVHTGAGVCAANNGPEWAAGEPQGRLKYNYKPNWRPSPKQLRSEPARDDREKLFTEENFGTRVLFLNRTRSLNTLDRWFIRRIRKQLEEWESNNVVEAVVIKSNLDEFFCRGGDVKYLHACAKDPSLRREALTYFKEEYKLSHLIATYTKPLAIQLNGEVLGTSLSMMGKHRLSQENTVFSVPDCARGSVPGAGASHVLSRLKHGLGMYLALTGLPLEGNLNYWAGLSNMHTHSDLAEQFLVSSLGRVTSQDRSNFCMEHDPMFQRNNALIAENRDALRHEHLNENTSIAREDMTRYTRLKGWYQYYKLKRHDLAYRWWERQPQGPEATGKLFHFASPPQDNGYWEPVEPRHRVMWDRVEHALSTVFDLESPEMPTDVRRHFEEIAAAFEGDPDQGDTLLVMEADPDAHQTTYEEYRAVLKNKLLPSNYFPKFKTEMRSIITRSLIAEGLVPEPLHQPELLSVTKQLLEQSWPTADADSETVMQACLEAGLPESHELSTAVQMAVRESTARLTGVPVWAMDPNPPAKPATKQDELLDKLDATSPGGDDLEPVPEDDDLFDAMEHLHAGHLRVTPEYEEMPPVDVDDLARTALQSRDASVTGNPEDMSAEDIMAAAQESVGDDFDLSVLDDSSDDEEVATQSLGNEVADESDGPTSEEVLDNALTSHDYLSEEYKQRLLSDPEELRRSVGMPNTPLTRDASKYLVRALRAERKAQHGVPQVRSLDEIYSRLNKQNTDVSRSAMAAMLEASPTALRITHRLITEGSVKTLAECLRMEYRVNARVLETPDFVEGINAAMEGRKANWAPDPEDVSAFFARDDPDGRIGELAGLEHRRRAWAEIDAEDARYEAELDKFYMEGAVQGAGRDELRSRFMWIPEDW